MGSFGSSSSKQKSNASSGINDKFLPYAMDALDRAEQVGNQGYVPYRGIDVALPDSLVNSWQNTANRAAAFNTPGQPAQSIRSQLPITTQNGIQGLSSYSGYQDQLNKLKTSSPGLYNYIKGFAIDPVTGKPTSSTMDTGGNNSGNGSGNGAGGNGAGGGGFQPSLMALIQQGLKSGGVMGGAMALMGAPYLHRDGRGQQMQQTSAYRQLFDQYINNGAGQDPLGAWINQNKPTPVPTGSGGGSSLLGGARPMARNR